MAWNPVGSPRMTSAILAILIAALMAGCINDPFASDGDRVPTPQQFAEDDAPRMIYLADQWPEETDFLLLRLAADEPAHALLNVSYTQSMGRSNNDILQLHADPETREEDTGRQPMVMDLLVGDPEGEWTSREGPARWSYMGWSAPAMETLYMSSDTPLGTMGLSVGANIGTSWAQGMGNRALLQDAVVRVTPEAPLWLLLYAPGEYDGRTLRLVLIADEAIEPTLHRGHADIVSEAGRLPVGDGERSEFEFYPPNPVPGDNMGQSTATGTPITLETTGPTLFYVHALTGGVGTLEYAYQPPEHDPVEVKVRIEDQVHRPRTTTAIGETPQFGRNGGIGPAGAWGFHLIEEDCRPSSGPWSSSCIDTFHVAQLSDYEAWHEGLTQVDEVPPLPTSSSGHR